MAKIRIYIIFLKLCCCSSLQYCKIVTYFLVLGFASTIDTNVAITALKEMSKKLKLTDRNSKVVLQYTYLNTVRSMKVDSNKPTVMQKRILPSETKEVKLRAKGSGFALLQV